MRLNRLGNSEGKNQESGDGQHHVRGWLRLDDATYADLYNLERYLSSKIKPEGRGRNLLELYLNLCDQKGEEQLLRLPWQITPEALEDINHKRKNTIRATQWINRIKTLESGHNVLDLGCGGGMFGVFFAETKATVCGLDVESDVVKIARMNSIRYGVTANYTAGSAENIPYRDDTFDFCIANSLIEHVDNWQAVIQEIKRVLKKGGLVFIATTNKLHPFQTEINNFPFYPWLPEGIKKRVISWIMTRRPDLVNYGACPAIHWFTHTRFRKYLEELGFDTYDVTDIVERKDLKGIQRIAASFIPLIKRSRLLKRLCYFYLGTVSIWAVKN